MSKSVEIHRCAIKPDCFRQAFRDQILKDLTVLQGPVSASLLKAVPFVVPCLPVTSFYSETSWTRVNLSDFMY